MGDVRSKQQNPGGSGVDKAVRDTTKGGKKPAPTPQPKPKGGKQKP